MVVWFILFIFVIHKTIERMKNYELCLYEKNTIYQGKYFIDSTLIENCKDRDEAMVRVKRLMMYQGLTLSKYKFTLKKTNKVKEYLED